MTLQSSRDVGAGTWPILPWQDTGIVEGPPQTSHSGKYPHCTIASCQRVARRAGRELGPSLRSPQRGISLTRFHGLSLNHASTSADLLVQPCHVLGRYEET